MIVHGHVNKLNEIRVDPFGAFFARIGDEILEFGGLRRESLPIVIYLPISAHNRTVAWIDPEAVAATRMNSVIRENTKWRIFRVYVNRL